MTDYRYWLGVGKPLEWMKWPAGYYPKPLEDAPFLKDRWHIAYVYDEYENLLFVVNAKELLINMVCKHNNGLWHSSNLKAMMNDTLSPSLMLGEIIDCKKSQRAKRKIILELEDAILKAARKARRKAKTLEVAK